MIDISGTLGLAILLLLAHPSFAYPTADEVVVASDIAVDDTQRVEKIQIPKDVIAVEVRLKIANPKQLDIDLILYDSDPTNAYSDPLCISDSIEEDEICAAKRPESGEVWAVVAAVEGTGKSPFTLTRKFVDPSRAELVLARPISPNTGGTPVDPENINFQFKLSAESVATVVLEGEERTISVEDEDGRTFHALKTGVGRQQIAVGEKFQRQSREADWLLQGVTEAKRYLIRLGPSQNPYGEAGTVLSVVTPARKTKYVIAFAAENLDNEPVTIQGPPRNLTRAGRSGPLLFRFLPNRSPLMIAQATPAETYDVAICDEYGFVSSISPEEVLWDPKKEDAAQNGSEDMYFVVFPSPLSESATAGLPRLTLLIKPPTEP